MHTYSQHLRHVFTDIDEFRATVRDTVDILRGKIKSKILANFDYIACRGVSGLSIASPVAIRMKKNLIFVRKPIDMKESHASTSAEGVPIVKRFSYIIIDDFVCSGSTVYDTCETIYSINPLSSLLGMVQYNEAKYFPADTIMNGLSLSLKEYL